MWYGSGFAVSNGKPTKTTLAATKVMAELPNGKTVCVFDSLKRGSTLTVPVDKATAKKGLDLSKVLTLAASKSVFLSDEHARTERLGVVRRAEDCKVSYGDKVSISHGATKARMHPPSHDGTSARLHPLRMVIRPDGRKDVQVELEFGPAVRKVETFEPDDEIKKVVVVKTKPLSAKNEEEVAEVKHFVFMLSCERRLWVTQMEWVERILSAVTLGVMEQKNKPVYAFSRHRFHFTDEAFAILCKQRVLANCVVAPNNSGKSFAMWFVCTVMHRLKRHVLYACSDFTYAKMLLEFPELANSPFVLRGIESPSRLPQEVQLALFDNDVDQRLSNPCVKGVSGMYEGVPSLIMQRLRGPIVIGSRDKPSTMVQFQMHSMISVAGWPGMHLDPRQFYGNKQTTMCMMWPFLFGVEDSHKVYFKCAFVTSIASEEKMGLSARMCSMTHFPVLRERNLSIGTPQSMTVALHKTNNALITRLKKPLPESDSENFQTRSLGSLIKFSSGEAWDGECPVCFGDARDDSLVALPCLHTFCHSCMRCDRFGQLSCYVCRNKCSLSDAVGVRKGGPFVPMEPNCSDRMFKALENTIQKGQPLLLVCDMRDFVTWVQNNFSDRCEIRHMGWHEAMQPNVMAKMHEFSNVLIIHDKVTRWVRDLIVSDLISPRQKQKNVNVTIVTRCKK